MSNFKISDKLITIDINYQSRKDELKTIYIRGRSPQIRAEMEIRIKHFYFYPITTVGTCMAFKVSNISVFYEVYKKAKAGFPLY